MSTEYAQYAAEHGVEFDWSATGYRLTVTLTKDGHTESFTWYQGPGIETEPDVGDVLKSLVSDAYAGEENFEDFCDIYGYDTDSGKAYAPWEACKRVGQQLRDLFGEIPEVES